MGRMGSRDTTTSPTGTDAGFTLIELALITVILGILVTAAIPRLQQTARRMRVEQSAFELAQLLRAAHEQAVAGGREIVWVWDADAGRARLEPGESGRVPAFPGTPEPETMTSRSFPEGLSVLLTQDGQAVACSCVRFFPEGTSEPATLTVRLQEQLITATVDDATGQVRLVPGAVAR